MNKYKVTIIVKARSEWEALKEIGYRLTTHESFSSLSEHGIDPEIEVLEEHHE